GSHSDITERKIIEEVLRESEKKYRTLFEESKDAIIVLDKARRVIDINDAFIELFGYTREEIFALDLEKLYCKREDRNVLWQKLEGFGFASDFEMELKRKDDERIIVHVSASAIKDDAGQISGYQGIFHDMTDRKKLEQQLLQAQKLESIGLLAGGVAHEFNNLLTGISGYGQIIEEIIPPDDELLQESVGQILRATDRAAELARSLLAFGRKQLIHPKPVHVHTIVHDTVGLIKRIIGEDIELRTSFSDKNLLVKVGEGQIEQILMNLATNARDAMPSGGHIHIATQEVVVKDGSESNYGLARPGVYVLISVSDTGTGIDKKSLERVFEPFYTTKEIGKGTGLGLSVIYGIVKQNNGSVHVESEPGEGTTVSIYLPTTNEVPIGIEKRHKAKPVFRGTETILVAEDDEMVQRFISKVLKWAGYSVITAKDGEDAVMKFKKEMDVISLVLTDVVMPKKNGKEILGEIKKLRPEIRVIFISGYSAEFIDKNVINKDSTTFITKPFLKTDLLQKVREVLDRD
ncbi:MAG TPA: PAS domain S-box protein, partial [Syntrophales bacterium]|nr:PAS domain S-box protein [Syntrophales bacterium]